MFFLELIWKELPRELKTKIEKLYLKDKEIFRKNKEGKNVDLDVIDFSIQSLTIFFEYYKKVNKRIKDSLTEGIGAIPIVFFCNDNLKVSKEIEETLDPLIDIMNSHANLYINREKFIRETLKKLRELRKKYKKST